MKSTNMQISDFNKRLITALVSSLFLLISVQFSFAQHPELSLADLIVALRSKKTTLRERNQILAKAVRERGITFQISPQIEKELTATGASQELLEALKAPKSVAGVTTSPGTVSAATPEPDFDFLIARADENLGKGEYSLALPDYNRAVELKPNDAIAYLKRGNTYFNLKAINNSLVDFDKAIELDPKSSAAFFSRAISNEGAGKLENAVNDYKTVLDLDPQNELAAANLKRLQDSLKPTVAVKETPPVVVDKTPPTVPDPIVRPEFVNLGSLTAAQAIKMVAVRYPAIAQQARVEGKVTVEVEINEEGKVVSAQATTGHRLLKNAAIDAAKDSRFIPPTLDGKPIKGKGTITYNFTIGK